MIPVISCLCLLFWIIKNCLTLYWKLTSPPAAFLDVYLSALDSARVWNLSFGWRICMVISSRASAHLHAFSVYLDKTGMEEQQCLGSFAYNIFPVNILCFCFVVVFLTSGHFDLFNCKNPPVLEQALTWYSGSHASIGLKQFRLCFAITSGHQEGLLGRLALWPSRPHLPDGSASYSWFLLYCPHGMESKRGVGGLTRNWNKTRIE